MKVLAVATHPVQYLAPLFRLASARPGFELTVAYGSLEGATPMRDPEFGVELRWDVPLLDGYRWTTPRNLRRRPSLDGFLGQLNPGVVPLAAAREFDVVVCYGYRNASLVLAAVAAKAGRPAVALVTDAQVLAPRTGTWKLPLKRALVPRIYRAYDGVLGMSSRSVAFARSLGVREERTFLLPYVVDNDFFAARAAEADPAAVRARLAVPDGAPLVLFSGKLVPWKRPRDLLEAAARVDGLHVAWAGDGPLRAELEARAARLGVARRMRFLGFVGQTALPGLYAAADVVCLPSEYEPFGLVVNEAFACGTPAVVSDACGAADDLVADGVTGAVVPVGAVDALADRLAAVAAASPRLGAAARERIAEWSPQRHVDALVGACAALARRA
ncbi:MAG TPA: glycosyltransferase family 4 protein [Gaiellaceae bacterium]|nr:glycosyltransferase family 4 protein [Gaiellaceae bacterium]